MSIHKHLIKLKIKYKVTDCWYGLWKVVGKIMYKPYFFVKSKKVDKLSNPDNYNRRKLFKIIEKQMAKELLYFEEIYLLHSNNTYKSDFIDLDLPYHYINNSQNKYMVNYRRFAFRNDKSFDWAQYIIDNIDLEYQTKTGKDFIGRYNPAYDEYKDTNVYIFKLK